MSKLLGRKAHDEASDAKGEAREAAMSTPMKALGRFGYAAKGIVYLIIGGLSAKVAIGAGGGSTTDRNGALRAVYQQPLGKLLLAIVAIGLVSYAVWSFIQAIVDPENRGTDARGIATRIGYGVIGISYGALAIAAAQLVIGAGNGGQSSNAQTHDWTARVLALPFGPVLVVLAGISVLGAAGFLFYRVFTADFRKTFALEKLGSAGRQGIIALGRAGYAALGVVFGIVGVFLIIAAVRKNAGASKGMGDALQELSVQPYGHLLLGIVAVGLVAYGVFSLAQARYRRLVSRSSS